jgi:hypothetical protein
MIKTYKLTTADGGVMYSDWAMEGDQSYSLRGRLYDLYKEIKKAYLDDECIEVYFQGCAPIYRAIDVGDEGFVGWFKNHLTIKEETF